MVWYSNLSMNFPEFIVVHTVKGFGIVNKAETDVFLELSCFFDDPLDVGNLISGSPAFSKSSLNIWKFMIHILLKCGLENFEHYFTSLVAQMIKNLPAMWRSGFNPWIGKFPWRRERLPTPVFLPAQLHGHKGACLVLNYSFVLIYSQEWNYWIIWYPNRSFKSLFFFKN